MATNLNNINFSSGLEIDWDAVIEEELAEEERKTQQWLDSFKDSGKETVVDKAAPVIKAPPVKQQPPWLDTAVRFIKEREDFVPVTYDDPLKPGIRTSGYGRTEANISGRKLQDKVSEDQATSELIEDLIATNNALKGLIKPEIYDNFNINQKAAIISLVDNVGISSFIGSNALKFLNSGEIDEALLEMFNEDRGWTKITRDGKKVKARGLVNRRNLEFKLYQTPLPDAAKIKEEVKNTLKLSDKGKEILQEDADSWSNQIAIGTDNMLASLNNGLAVFVRMAGFDEQAAEFERTSKEYEKSALSRPRPSRDPIPTKEFKRIEEKFSDNQVVEGMAEIAKQGKTYTSAALPFLAPSVATLSGVKMAAPILRRVPIIGPPINIISQVVLPLLPGFVMGGGEIHKEAKEKGATDEKADSAALGGGFIVGLLDRFGASVIVNSWIKAFGKDRVAKIVASQVGEKAAADAIKKASKLGVTSVVSSALKGGLKSGGAEFFTEGAQEKVIIESVAAATGLRPENEGERLINAAVLGYFGGQAPGTISGALSPLMKKEAANRIEEFKESDAELGRSVVEQDKELELMDSKDINLKTFAPGVTSGVRRSLTFVKEPLSKTEVGRQLFNRLGSFFFNTNVEAGNLLRRIENEVVRGVLKDTKLPFSRRIKKKISEAVGKRLRGREIDTKKFSNQELTAIENAKDNARKILGEVDQDGNPIDSKSIYGLLRESGVELGFVEDYLRNSYKIPMFGLGKRKAKKEFLKILKSDPKTAPVAEEILDNILSHNNVYTGEQSVNLFPDRSEGPTLPVGRRGFELPRVIPKEVVDKLDDAGLVQNNFEGIMKTLAIAASRRAETQRIFNDFNKRKDELGLSDIETKRIKDIYQAVQGNYKPFERLGFQKLNQFLATAGYVTTLPLAAVISLSEPVIVLSRVSPKNAMWGLIKASRVGLSKAIRTIRPKHKIKDLENAFNGLLQTADLASQNAIRDLENMSINKRITDKFFRITMLAQVTQFSRQIAFAAATKQLKDDLTLLEVEQETGSTPTLQTVRARRRLREQGLSNLFSDKRGKIPSLGTEPKIKGYTAAMSEAIGFGLKRGETFVSRSELKDMRSRIKKKDINEYKKARQKYDRQKERISRLRRGDRQISNVEEETMAWARGQSEPPILIQRAIGKTVDEVIMSPNAVNRPLWMSNPHFALAAQLKGFMTVFGNTVGYKLYKEVFQPLSPLHRTREGLKVGMPQVNPEATFRYALMFTILMGAMYGTQVMKDVIRYEDPDDSPLQELEEWELFFYLLKQSNLMGYGNIFVDIAESSRYGTSQIAAALGPVPTKIERLLNAMDAFGDGRPRQLASWLSKNTPFIGALGTEERAEILTDRLEELLEPLSDTIKDFRE